MSNVVKMYAISGMILLYVAAWFYLRRVARKQLSPSQKERTPRMANEWISVKDRLPPFGDQVIVGCKSHPTTVAELHTYDASHTVFLEDGIHKIGWVTHWQDMPTFTASERNRGGKS